MRYEHPLRRCAPSPSKGDDGLCRGAALAGRLYGAAAPVLCDVDGAERRGELE